MKAKAPKVGADDFVAAGLGEAELSALPREGLAHTFERHGDEFLVSWPEHKVSCALTAIHENGDGVHAELAVSHDGVDVHWGRLGLASTQAREGVVRKLDSIVRGAPWRSILETTCRETVRSLRATSATVTLRGRRAAGPAYLVDPLLPLNAITVGAADGGQGKGHLAVRLALAVKHRIPLAEGMFATTSAEVLYLDWESDKDDLDDRLYRHARGAQLDAAQIHYRRMYRALSEEAAALRADVSRLNIGFLIIDSLAPACGPEPEGADAAIRTFGAIRSLGPLTVLCLAHISKASADQRGPARPFGSVFVQNLARSVWELRRDPESDDLLIGLYHRKVNRGRLSKPLALRFRFTADAITLGPADIQEAPELAARTSVTTQVLAALRTGAKTAPALADELGLPAETVSRTLRRLGKPDTNKVVRLSTEGRTGRGQEMLWGLQSLKADT
jgi:hypothetical protein